MATNTIGNAILEQAEKIATSTEYTSADGKLNNKNLQNTTALSDQENKIIETQRLKDYLATSDNIIKQQEAAKLIDDGYFKSLPKSIVRMYKNGDFGDTSTKEGKKNAKNTLGLAIVSTLANTLGNIGNSVSAVGGVAGTYQNNDFVDTIRKTNLEEGLKNKWEKQKQTTQSAIDILKKRGVDEEEAQSSVQRLTSNARMQSQFNRMTQDEKVYALEVSRLIGKEIGDLSDPSFLQLMQGMAASGASPQECAIIAGFRYAPTAGAAIYKQITGQDVPSDLGNALTVLGEKVETGITPKPKDGKKNTTTIETPAGTVEISKSASKEEFSNINKNATALNNMFVRGEISEDEWRKSYTDLYNEQQKHGIASGIGKYYGYVNLQSPDDMFASLNNDLEMWKNLQSDIDAKKKVWDDAVNERAKYEKGTKEYNSAQKQVEKANKEYQKAKENYKAKEQKIYKTQQKAVNKYSKEK